MDTRELNEKLAAMGLIVEKVEQWAATRPDKLFIYYGEEDASYTYAQFNRLVNCVAHNLRGMGVSKGDRVSLFLKNPWVTVLSMYALWKLGAVFCPINFLYKGRLLSYQLSDTGPKLLITESGREPLLNQIKDELPFTKVVIHRPTPEEHDYNPETAGLRLEPPFEEIAFADLLDGNPSNPGVEINFWDTANIVYTSGTTGPPKGVVQSFRWMQNYCFYGVRMLHPDDVAYCDLPMYHIGGAFSLVGRAAWRGCTVSLWHRFSASGFWRRIKVSGASVALLLDVMMPWLLKAEPKPDDRENTLRRVHMQPLPEYHHVFAQRFGLDFVNVGYGATEVGYVCAGIIDESVNGGGTPPEFAKGYSKEEVYQVAQELGMPIIPGHKEIPKGYMGNACMLHRVAILDEHDQEMEPGEYGQICLRPRLPYVLLNEYFNKPEATVATNRNFWFHTGDGARYDDKGMFYFVDRMGGFIRVKGENISSFQVEDVINTHPKVRMSAAFPVAASEGLEDDIVVYIVVDQGHELDETELRSWLDREMPAYMRPRHLRFVESLPQTPTYKVEKYKLKEMFLAESRD
ncbi:MAG: AMP-binding protein [Desulfarculaceae bacterium]|nr:AMP-binding protein [Desulfarculaceae bacterium]